MSEAYPYPRIGTGVWIRRSGKVLLGFRTWKHAPNTWAPPGGKLDMFETIENCACREVLEETGLKVRNPKFITLTNDVYEEVGQHYVTLHYVVDWKAGEAKLTEPEKFREWKWFGWDELPKPLLRSTRNFIKTGYNPLKFK